MITIATPSVLQCTHNTQQLTIKEHKNTNKTATNNN